VRHYVAWYDAVGYQQRTESLLEVSWGGSSGLGRQVDGAVQVADGVTFIGQWDTKKGRDVFG